MVIHLSCLSPSIFRVFSGSSAASHSFYSSNYSFPFAKKFHPAITIHLFPFRKHSSQSLSIEGSWVSQRYLASLDPLTAGSQILMFTLSWPLITQPQLPIVVRIRAPCVRRRVPLPPVKALLVSVLSRGAGATSWSNQCPSPLLSPTPEPSPLPADHLPPFTDRFRRCQITSPFHLCFQPTWPQPYIGGCLHMHWGWNWRHKQSIFWSVLSRLAQLAACPHKQILDKILVSIDYKQKCSVFKFCWSPHLLRTTSGLQSTPWLTSWSS